MNANSKQYGGTHYQCQAIQPWDYVTANNLGYLEGTAIKYITRWRHKNGTEDIRKAIHFLEKLLEVESTRSASPGMECSPNDSTVVCERQSLQARGIDDVAHSTLTIFRDVNEYPNDGTAWPFPNYLGTGLSRSLSTESTDNLVGRLCNFRAVDEQTGDSFPVYASNVENMPILRADTDDV